METDDPQILVMTSEGPTNWSKLPTGTANDRADTGWFSVSDCFLKWTLLSQPQEQPRVNVKVQSTVE